MCVSLEIVEEHDCVDNGVQHKVTHTESTTLLNRPSVRRRVEPLRNKKNDVVLFLDLMYWSCTVHYDNP